MAIDPNPPPKPLDETAASAIENELPAYRAISPMAVTSLILGLASILCFADLWFLVAAGLAVLSGLLALNKLRKYGDVLTGAGLAKAGIVLAIVFALSSSTISGVQSALRYRGASQFAADFVKRLNAGKSEDILWYRLPPPQRRGLSPGEFSNQVHKTKEPNSYTEFAAQVDRLAAKVIGPPRKTFKFLRVETAFLDKTTNEAAIVYQMEGPPAKDDRPGEDLLLLQLMAEDSPRANNWFINSIAYPYVPANYNPKAKQEAEEKAHGHIH